MGRREKRIVESGRKGRGYKEWREGREGGGGGSWSEGGRLSGGSCLHPSRGMEGPAQRETLIAGTTRIISVSNFDLPTFNHSYKKPPNTIPPSPVDGCNLAIGKVPCFRNAVTPGCTQVKRGFGRFLGDAARELSSDVTVSPWQLE